jgi:hypothetical protein
MPQLGAENIKSVELPTNDPNDPVRIKLNVNVQLQDIDGTDLMGSVDTTAKTLERCILEWNMTDSEGKPAPITFENVRKLNLAHTKRLVNMLKMTGIFEENAGKKKLS